MPVDHNDDTADKYDKFSDFILEQNDVSEEGMLMEQDDRPLENNLIIKDDINVDFSIDDSCLNNLHDGNSQDSVHNSASHDFTPSSPSIEEISTVLALFRHRHKLSKSCINDLCDLLRSFGVINVPSYFRSIEKILLQNQENVLQGRKYSVYSKCGNKGINTLKCDNIHCEFSSGFLSTPTTLCTFKLLPQITSILDRHNIMSEPDATSLSIFDVQDGQAYRSMISRERMIDFNKQIVTLLLNSDGIVLKKFSRSVWLTCMVINELPRAIRFDTRNVIICSISMGGIKPQKHQFQDFIKDWVIELQHLEQGFYITPPNLNGNYIRVHAYLIAAALDKPAQALLLNLNDPTGFYSCARCTIKGKL